MSDENKIKSSVFADERRAFQQKMQASKEPPNENKHHTLEEFINMLMAGHYKVFAERLGRSVRPNPNSEEEMAKRPKIRVPDSSEMIPDTRFVASAYMDDNLPYNLLLEFIAKCPVEVFYVAFRLTIPHLKKFCAEYQPIEPETQRSVLMGGPLNFTEEEVPNNPDYLIHYSLLWLRTLFLKKMPKMITYKEYYTANSVVLELCKAMEISENFVLIYSLYLHHIEKSIVLNAQQLNDIAMKLFETESPPQDLTPIFKQLGQIGEIKAMGEANNQSEGASENIDVIEDLILEAEMQKSILDLVDTRKILQDAGLYD